MIRFIPLLLTVVAWTAYVAAAPIEVDVVIRNGTIHVGAGKPPVLGSIGIRGDRIVAIGEFEALGQPQILDAAGLIVSPGFIDLHTHSDDSILRPGTRSNNNYLLQGVTSIVTGNCGGGPTDVDEYLSKIEQAGAGSNVLHLIPHGSLRRRVMGPDNRSPTADELRQMCELTAAGMKAGAWGMSTGLIYTPGSFSKTPELIELAKVVGAHNGIYASHIRNENVGLIGALEEALEIGREAKLPIHISHFKASGQRAWGMSGDAIRYLQLARDQGQRVTADQYPYVASSTSLSATLIPQDLRIGTALETELADPVRAKALVQRIQKDLDEREGGKRIVIASYEKNRSWQGKNLWEISQEQGVTAVDLVISIEREGGAKIVNFGMHEDDVRAIMQQSFVATASDGSAMDPSEPTMPHPRSYGCFARKIGRYSLEQNVISLEQALRSASSLPAEILSLPERGLLKVGHFADLVVFDPATFRDQATFDKPHQHATGVQFVLVNGKIAVQNFKPTGVLAGRALRKVSGARR